MQDDVSYALAALAANIVVIMTFEVKLNCDLIISGAYTPLLNRPTANNAPEANSDNNMLDDEGALLHFISCGELELYIGLSVRRIIGASRPILAGF
jgi:hypothetical protein